MTFEQYATAQLPALLGTARAVCGDPSLAEDLVQDVLVKLHSRWHAVSRLADPDAYVRRMLVNEFISWQRKWSRLIPHAAPLIDGATLDDTDVHADRDAMLAAIRSLPPRQRVVIALRYYQDLPDSQIADALGCSESTVRVHASRALSALRRQQSSIR